MTISVCMATYNGEKYVARQLETIFGQLSSSDELVIVDDCSTDKTVEIIKCFQDPRLILHTNERNRREVYSFSRAIQLAKGGMIFMADQDDAWIDGRLAMMESRLRESDVFLLTSNFHLMNEHEQPLPMPFDGVRAEGSRNHFQKIADIFIGKTNYVGCAMAFRRELVPLITPIPDYVESHDVWIALAANLIGSHLHIDEKTLHKRQHSNNTTQFNRSLYPKLKARAIFTRSLIELQRRRRGLSRGRKMNRSPSKP
jgi:glycosyltransferase involved in cell wall biosynthesis